MHRTVLGHAGQHLSTLANHTYRRHAVLDKFVVYRVKVKVTVAKKWRKSLFSQCKTLSGKNSGSLEDKPVKFVCIMGFSAMADRMVCDRYFCHVTEVTTSN